MSRPASELEAALRTVTHDVRAAAGVLLSALDELSREVPADGRANDLMRMMRRSARRLEILADASELIRHSDPTAVAKVSIDLSVLLKDVVASRMAIERAAPVNPTITLPPSAKAHVVVAWYRYIIGECVGYAAKRAKDRLTIELSAEPDGFLLVISSDASGRPGEIGPVFTHPLGLAAHLLHEAGGSLHANPLHGDHEDTVRLELRIPRGV